MSRFTKEAARRGGWARARAWAEWRRSNPSNAEALAQEILTRLGLPFVTEYEITHEDGRPQWIDILVLEPRTAIEVDGSHGWHGWNGGGSKMDYLDEIKHRWCERNNLPIVVVRQRDLTEEYFSAMFQQRKQEDTSKVA